MTRKIASSIILILFLSFVAAAQEKQLSVGDAKSEISVFRWIKGKGPTQLQRGKVYLIEFGSTWCVPCRQAIPHLVNLQNQMKDSLTIISLFVMEVKKHANDSAYLSTIRSFISKAGSSINYLVGADDPSGNLENGWLKAANLTGIPYAFLIDKTGHIAWIGSPNSSALEAALHMVNQKDYTVEMAIRRDKEAKAALSPLINIYQPMFVNGNGGNVDHFLSRSILTEYRGERSPYIDYILSPFLPFKKDANAVRASVQIVGAPIDKLYFMAYADTFGQLVASRQLPLMEYPDTLKAPVNRDRYGHFWYKAILEVSDSTPFKWSFKDLINRYNYSLVVNNDNASAYSLQRCMQRELDTYFGYRVSVEERMMPYWRLIGTPDAKTRLKAKDGKGKYLAEKIGDTLVHYHNAIMKDILVRLIYPFSYSNMAYSGMASSYKPIEEAPFVDETGIDGFIDYDISVQEFDAMRGKDWNAAINFLHRIGLDVKKGERLTKVVVIRDPVN